MVGQRRRIRTMAQGKGNTLCGEGVHALRETLGLHTGKIIAGGALIGAGEVGEDTLRL